MLLDVRDLSKSFPGDAGRIQVLDGVSFTLGLGEVLALTGESGSGKSTLLHIVAGLEPADGGTVILDGVEVTGLGDAGRATLRRSDVGIVFQQFNLIPSLTVGQNIAFQARLADRFEPRSSEDLSAALGLTDQLNKYPEELSGGQQQRVAIARALLPAPKLVLADEPTGNLDEATADAVFEALLSQVRHADAGLLLVTHSERLAARADRRLHLS
ncbi:MAG: ABC transporter ATP-binding protein, partial [Silicimonas sp.]|nr:ABC transporter ATP-binding protein [Silicimonas sp.]